MARLSRDQFLDLRPFRASPAFARLWIGSTLAGLGGQLTIVAVMLHVYDLTQSTFAVSMIAVVGLVPMVIAGLYGGMLADAFDRRLVALLAASITFVSTAALAILGRELGWAVLPGLAVIGAMLRLNKSIAAATCRLPAEAAVATTGRFFMALSGVSRYRVQKQLQLARDERARLTRELLGGIKAV